MVTKWEENEGEMGCVMECKVRRERRPEKPTYEKLFSVFGFNMSSCHPIVADDGFAL